MDNAEQFEHLFRLYAWIGGAVFVIVVAVLVIAVIRYRARPGRQPSRRTGAPRLESAYVVLIALIVALLLTFTYRTEARTDAVVRAPALRIRATASDWQWRFDYPSLQLTELGGGVGSAPTPLYVPSGERVEFDLTSLDVLHAFFIPAVDFQRQATPGSTTRFDLVFAHPGTLENGYCNEYCGLGHTNMRFIVHVLSPRAFAAWAATQQQQRSA